MPADIYIRRLSGGGVRHEFEGGDKPIDGVAGLWGAPGVNANGECLIETGQERGMIACNICFKNKRQNKNTWER